uniref:Ras modification protein ERF4 n=2 Tax=Steinernema glaseri TaxID=37863 RepID=A0A1I7XZ20_9BILA
MSYFRAFTDPNRSSTRLQAMEEAKIPLNACKKIFIERDYSQGLSVRFQTTFPTRLTGMISPDAWDNVITTLNSLFVEAERVCSSSVVETLLGCFTCYISRAFSKTIYERNLERIMTYIDEQNRDLFMPAGLFLSDPMERGLRMLEISILQTGASQGKIASSPSEGAAAPPPTIQVNSHSPNSANNSTEKTRASG